MIMDFAVTGEKRKKLANVVASITEQGFVFYEGAPSFAYKVGDITIDRAGRLIREKMYSTLALSLMLKSLADAGFTPVSITFERYTVYSPEMDLSEEALKRLLQIVKNKEQLFARAFGAETLTIHKDRERLAFPWFNAPKTPEEEVAYTKFVEGLCIMARDGHRVQIRPYDGDNDKYAMRSLLIRMGMNGQTHKETRKVLLSRLTGNSSWRHGPPSHNSSSS